MNHTVPKTFSEFLSEQQSSADEVTTLARDSKTVSEVFAQIALLVQKFTTAFGCLKDDAIIDTSPIFKSAESLAKELNRAKVLVLTSNKKTSVKNVESMAHDLGRSLELVLLASTDASIEIKEQIGALHKELMNVKFDCVSLSSSSNSSPSHRGSEFGDYLEVVEGDEIVAKHDEEQVMLQLKYGEDDEFKLAVLGLNDLIRDKMVDKEWIRDNGVIPVLLNRLASSNPNNRVIIIGILRTLALESVENKNMMTDVGSLSTIVKSMTRDLEERRVAVGLLLDLSDIHALRQRIGRIQGCIVMLVAMFNGDDPTASHDSGKLLNTLSSNIQNALHMAEAGYFKPLIHYLKEGSDMSKILMATSVSRLELTDQTKASLGDDGAIEPLVKMFATGKLEAKLYSLSALQNLSSLPDNARRLISSGIVVSLLQLLFSVTSVLMTLREPAAAILASIAQSESILVNQDVAQQMLSLLNLSSPVVQCHLLQALKSIAAHSSASKVRNKMKESGAIQLLLPFLAESNLKIRSAAMSLLYNLSEDLQLEFIELLEESHITIIVQIASSSTLDSEKAAAVGFLSNLPLSDKKTTNFLKRENLLPVLIAMMNSSPSFYTSTTTLLAESFAGVLIRFTLPSDKKVQMYSAQHGVIPLLVKLLSINSPTCKCRAATSLAQLSQNTLSIRKSRKESWLCVPSSANMFCEVHEGYCFIKTTFCLVKANAVSPLIHVLEGNERETDEAVLGALETLLQDEIWENGINYIVKMSGVEAVLKVLEMGNVKAQEKALWILERVFRVEVHRAKYGESAQALLIDLAQNGDAKLKPIVAKILAQLDLLQVQSSYF